MMEIIDKERETVTNAYKNLIKKTDFRTRLQDAIFQNICLLCSGCHLICTWGLCLECAQFVDRELLDTVENRFDVIKAVTVIDTLKN